MENFDFKQALAGGLAIPAHPLALDANRRLDERRQRALTRYYIDAGVGGLAVAVHTTQFAIRLPNHGLFEPVLALAAAEMNRAVRPLVRIGGVCGTTSQAVAEASLLRGLGYHAGLLSLAALRDADEDSLIAHCVAIAEVLPVIGFYLQPAVGGRVLPYSFWRRFAEIENVVAIKIAPFNRYQTLEVVRAVIASGREDIALYTGNDDHIVGDLLTPFRFEGTERRIVGGLLGHWAVWTRQRGRFAESLPSGRSHAGIAGAWRCRHRLQRGILRRRQRLSRLHRRSARSAAPARPPRRPLVPRPRGNLESRPGRGN